MTSTLPEDMRERIGTILAKRTRFIVGQAKNVFNGIITPQRADEANISLNKEAVREIMALLEETDRKAREEAKQTLNITDRIQLLLAKIEIHKLKANDHDWAVYVPDATKKELEAALAEIDALQSPSKESK